MMSDDTRRILDLVAQGKITVDEAQQLLSALNAPPADPSASGPDAAERPKPKWMRIAIHKAA